MSGVISDCFLNVSPVLGSSDAESRKGPGLPPCLRLRAGQHLLPVSDPLVIVSPDPDVTWVLGL